MAPYAICLLQGMANSYKYSPTLSPCFLSYFALPLGLAWSIVLACGMLVLTCMLLRVQRDLHKRLPAAEHLPLSSTRYKPAY